VAVGGQTKSRRLTLGTVVVCMTALLGACSNAPSPSVAAAASVGSSPVVSPPPSPLTQPSATIQPSPTPTAPPTPPAGPLTITWHRQSGPTTSTADGWNLMVGASVLDLHGTAILNVDTQGDGPQVWISADGLHWGAAAVPDNRKTPRDEALSLTSMATGGPGLVAVGELDDTLDDTSTSVVWTSVDGRAWNLVDDPSMAQGVGLQWVGSAGGSLIAFGAEMDDGVYKPQDWTSTDGLHWQVGSSASAAQVADGLIDLVSTDGVLTAFVGPATDTNDNFVGGKNIEVWRASDVGNWLQVGTLPGSTSPEVDVAHGPLGWIATGDGAKEKSVTWLSPDGVTWQAAGAPPPVGPQGGLVVDSAGFIAVGFRNTSQSCVALDKDNIGETWTSSDGRLWRQMPEAPQFKGAAIQMAFVRDRTLIGLGLDWNVKPAPSVVWTAQLPAASTAAGPTPIPSEKPVSSGGCGD
jgi:hypothetical protein